MQSHRAIDFHIRGLSPLMQHNGQLADPLNEYAKRLKAITSKRKKTDDDYAAMARIEWEGGLYLDDDDRVVVPGENIEAAFIMGGKKQKLGEQFKAGLLCDGLWPLIYKGPTTLAKLWDDGNFRDTRGVSVNQSRVMRTRPIFTPWELKFTVHYLPDILDAQQVQDSLVTVGRIIGLCDFTPKYGRFAVESARGAKAA